LAASVIAQANREHPADTVLRTVLREASGLARTEGRQISQAVFAYYRWLGWLDPAAGVPAGIEAALRLAKRFRQEPGAFSEAELRAHAVPTWAHQEGEMTQAWLQLLQTEPPLWIRARPGQGRALAKRLGNCQPAGDGPGADALHYTGWVDLHRTREFREGWFEIQDLHSQAVGWGCAPQPGETWWDACAGEGGKTLHLADLMENRGLIWATDRAAWRLAQLKRRAARARVFNYRARLWDGGVTLPTQTPFDGVLVDAPCSNLGTWHRNPHGRWTIQPLDVRELAAIQVRLLRHVVPAVKPGGRLVYAVCTMTRAETTEVVDTITGEFPELELLPLSAPLASARPTPRGLWLYPEPGGGNGMFVAMWRRRSPLTALAKGSNPRL
jgi:16S rRNA (cytosine967-C5)-methyltransferase